MDESTNTLLYTATYVFIFIIAVSLSIVLFLSVNRYADSAFEYKQGLNGSIINTGSTGLEEYQTGQVPLTKNDVFSYYVNYVKKDLYGNSNYDTNSDVIYDVSIADPETNSSNLGENLDYNSLQKKLSYKEKYFLEYMDDYYDDIGKKHVYIHIGFVS